MPCHCQHSGLSWATDSIGFIACCPPQLRARYQLGPLGFLRACCSFSLSLLLFAKCKQQYHLKGFLWEFTKTLYWKYVWPVDDYKPSNFLVPISFYLCLLSLHSYSLLTLKHLFISGPLCPHLTSLPPSFFLHASPFLWLCTTSHLKFYMVKSNFLPNLKFLIPNLGIILSSSGVETRKLHG